MVKKKIMIIDDDTEFLKELTENLKLSGYDARPVTNGTYAVQLMEEIKPDVIILDLKMDGKNGFQVADELRDPVGLEKIPIIAMTGFYTGEELNSLIRILGINTCLQKPFETSEILARISEALRKKKKRKTKYSKRKKRDI